MSDLVETANGPTLLERYMPTYQFRERHSTTVRATPERVMEAIHAVTAEEVALFRLLMGLRVLPARLVARLRGPAPRSAWRPPLTGPGPLLQQALRSGFVLLGQQGSREVAVGGAGQFWRLTGGRSASLRLLDAEDFAAFDRAGYAKTVLNFAVAPTPGRPGDLDITTETRVATPDPVARRAFATYWLIIRPGSGLIRCMWLRAIKRRAEAA